jgi:3-deoxy-D-manno-octulosonic-acid transferase
VRNISLAGDTRFDRVIEVAEGFLPVASIEAFSGDSEVIVAGSTWFEDDKELAGYVNSQKNLKFIIAPHNIGKERLNECTRLYTNSILFSAYVPNKPNPGINTIIIDNIGMLSSLYKYSTVSYIGGGFGAGGIHNVLEAAVYGKPVIFGPEYGKYFEAIELIENGGAVSVGNALELEKELDKLLKKEDYYNLACKASSDYVHSKKGSTDKILDFIQENRLLTN